MKPSLEHQIATAQAQLRDATRDVCAISLSGFASDISRLSPADRTRAIQLFSWAARQPEGFRALVEAHEKAKTAILRRRGVVAV